MAAAILRETQGFVALGTNEEAALNEVLRFVEKIQAESIVLAVPLADAGFIQGYVTAPLRSSASWPTPIRKLLMALRVNGNGSGT